MLFVANFPPAQRACNFDTSAVRNGCSRFCSLLRSRFLGCHAATKNDCEGDYMYRLCDRLRSYAIIWKQISLPSSAICDLLSVIVCDHMKTSPFGGSEYQNHVELSDEITNIGEQSTLFTGHSKPSGHGSRRIISKIHVSRKIKSVNHASREYPCKTLLQHRF